MEVIVYKRFLPAVVQYEIKYYGLDISHEYNWSGEPDVNEERVAIRGGCMVLRDMWVKEQAKANSVDLEDSLALLKLQDATPIANEVTLHTVAVDEDGEEYVAESRVLRLM